MSTRERPADRGRRVIRAAALRLQEDFRRARVAAGLSLRAVAHAVGVSHTHVRRFERGELRDPSIEFMASSCAVVGLDLVLRAYPAGDPLRVRAHAGLLERLRAELHPRLEWRTEVPLPIERDLRAWDAEIRGDGWRVRVEAEMRLADAQALERRLALKLRDGGPGHLVLPIADTRANREALAVMRPGLRALLPFDSRQILAALRRGEEPPGSGIVIL